MSLAMAREYLSEARQGMQIGTPRLATNGVYMAWFHAARAVLFHDGIREKRTHYCIELYLGTYAASGNLESRWVTLFGRIRSMREQNQYSFETPASGEEIEGWLSITEQFIERIETVPKLP